MLISYNWLKDYLDFEWTPQELADVLTQTGLEVEGLEKFQSVPGGLEGVIIGEVKEVEKHPNADRLSVCKVDVGASELLNIVCGAPNVAQGQRVPVATVGTTLHPFNGDPFEIKKSKIRGELSEGMICAADELGLGEDHSGILVLEPTTEIGTKADAVFGIETDWVIEIGLTANRGDATSHYGVARDAAAVLRKRAKLPEIKLPETGGSAENPVAIELPQPELCPRYTGILIRGIKVGESPDWLKNRLKAIGSRPINNVVDVTNFVLHELGHPLHAFDASKIRGGKIVVKTLDADSKYYSLDDEERSIRANKDLMICDGEGPIAIAGVMGGANSAVTETTTDIYLESAYFDPVSIRGTAKGLILNTDASFRFERGADPNMTITAARRATDLLLELCGGEASVIVDAGQTSFPEKDITYDVSKGNDLMGREFSNAEVKELLESLEITVASEADGKMELKVPQFRVDVDRPQDVMEEILRIYGYNNIEFPEKTSFTIKPGGKQGALKVRDKYFEWMAANGFQEIITNSLVPENKAADNSVKLINNLSEDLAVMRTSLLGTGLESIAYNHNRKNTNLRFVESGKVYEQSGDSYNETEQVALYMTGNKAPAHWSGKDARGDFYALSQQIQRIQDWFEFKAQVSELDGDPELSFGLKLHRGDKIIARYGMVKPEITKQYDIELPVYYAVIDWQPLYKAAIKQKVSYKPVPKFPAINRDISMLVPADLKFDTIQNKIRGVKQSIIRKVGITDVYSGKGVPEGMRSYLVNITMQDDAATMTDKVADKLMDKIFSLLEKDLGATIRK